jgi:hypothetical protein
LVCLAKVGSDDCIQSRFCKRHGFCSIAPFSDIPRKYGECRPLTDADCISSTGCKSNGYCVAAMGNSCSSDRVGPEVDTLVIGTALYGSTPYCCIRLAN